MDNYPTISINYNDGIPLSYKSVQIVYNFTKNIKIFDTGDFVKDWYDCSKFKVKLDKHDFEVKESPSVNKFISDGAEFDNLLLKRGNPPYLTKDRGNYNYFEKLTFFVKKGTTPTWKELKVLCGDGERVPPKVIKTIYKYNIK